MRSRGAVVAMGVALLASPTLAASVGGDSAYSLAAPGGGTAVRVVTAASACPMVTIDGRATPMTLRAAPAVLPPRPTASPPELSKVAAYPVRVCEALAPAASLRASIAGRAVPLMRAAPRRIVVIGDTGCRLKASDAAYQACNDPRAYPFARIARAAAAWRPDLVIHVGDYLYRENPCAPANKGCAGSPWGYGWDAWRADLFAPAAPLLAAVPWVVTRGNHESCRRAGQGWWRLLDPRPLMAGRDCIDPAQDAAGDAGAPYLAPLGRDAQVVVMDLSAAGNKAMTPDDPRWPSFAENWRFLRDAGAAGRFTFAVDHFPILGFRGDKKVEGGVTPENRAVQSVFARQPGPLIPAGIDVLLAGHVHLWEQVSVGKDYPSQFIAGFSGTQEDVARLPARLPAGTEAAPGARASRFASWTDGFGWMTLERRGPRRWAVTVRDVTGRIVDRCRIDGRISACDRARI